MPEANWTIIEHVGLAGFASVEPDWRRLYLEMPEPEMWHSYEAYGAYLRNLCPDPARFRCLALTDGKRVRAILPLEERIDRSFVERGKGFPIRIWGMPWHEAWWITDAIGVDDVALRALVPSAVQYLRKDPHRPALLVLGRSREGAGVWEGLAQFSGDRLYAFADGGEFVIPTRMTATEFAARLSGRSRQKLNRARRDHASLEGARCIRAVELQELTEEYEHFVEIEASGWKGAHGSAVRQLQGSEAFYRDLISGLSADGRCEIHGLGVGERRIASSLCVYTRNRGAMLKSGYDESFAYLSPGRLREQISLEWACEDPAIDSVTQMSDAAWLRLWNPDVNHIRRAYIALRPVSGRLMLMAYRLRYGPIRALIRAVKARQRARDDRMQPRRGRDSI